MPDFRAEATRCTALTNKGKFCDFESLPDAPFPICVKHAALILRYLNSYTPTSTDDRVILAVRAMEQSRPQQAERKRHSTVVEVVYYAQVGNRIKIGYTTNLASRMRAYPPGSRLLAYERGDLAVEAQRHAQFADYLEAGREWFAPSPELMAHIGSLKQQAA